MEDIEIASNRASFTFDKNRNDQPTDSNRGIITKDTEIEGEIKKFIQEKIEMLYKELQADFTHKLENITNQIQSTTEAIIEKEITTKIQDIQTQLIQMENIIKKIKKILIQTDIPSYATVAGKNAV